VHAGFRRAQVAVRFVDLSSDRLLWDLAYNGILHSVIAGGAETNWMLRKTLALPCPESASNGEQKRSDADDNHDS